MLNLRVTVVHKIWMKHHFNMTIEWQKYNLHTQHDNEMFKYIIDLKIYITMAFIPFTFNLPPIFEYHVIEQNS